jgi:hypothetical protein
MQMAEKTLSPLRVKQDRRIVGLTPISSSSNFIHLFQAEFCHTAV